MLFQAAGVGAVVFAFSHLVVLLIHCVFPTANDIWQSGIPYPFSDTVALGTLLTLILPPLGNWIWDEEESAIKAATEAGDRVELLLTESIRQEEFVEITLATGKAYIGRALGHKSVAVTQPDIALIPLMSGYRDKDTQELELTINYASVIPESRPDGYTFLENDYFRIVIPRAQIVSVRFFDPGTYEVFRNTPDTDDGSESN